MIRLLALVQKPAGLAPNQRFRLEQWAPFLERDHGIAVEFEPFESPPLTRMLYQRGGTVRKIGLVLGDAWRRRDAVARARAFDAVVILRESSLLGGAWVERALARAGVPFVFDFDDAIWLWSASGPNGAMTLARCPWKVVESCRLAAAVTVGNEFLADYARTYNQNVALVRTSIDVERFRVAPEPDAAPFTVVWTGSHSTLAHLETARDAIEALGREMPLRVRVVCDVSPPAYEHATLDFRAWSAEREAADLAAGHVGIMPLPNDAFARGKCGCKALQYMAIGRPVVVSPVGINRDVVTDGVSGYWADGTDQWVARLRRLATDPGLRAAMGAAARERVLDGFTAEQAAADFAAVVRQVVAGRVERRQRRSA